MHAELDAFRISSYSLPSSGLAMQSLMLLLHAKYEVRSGDLRTNDGPIDRTVDVLVTMLLLPILCN